MAWIKIMTNAEGAKAMDYLLDIALKAKWLEAMKDVSYILNGTELNPEYFEKKEKDLAEKQKKESSSSDAKKEDIEDVK